MSPVFEQDITSLTRSRAETERVAEDLTQLIDTANAPIFGIDADGLVNEWNQTAARITGFSKDEVMGRHLVDNFITEEYRESVGSVLHDALQGTETANYEFPLYTKGGDRVEVLLNATTRRDTNGSITGVVGVGQDITELAQYRAETERVAEDLTQLIDTANAPIFGIDADGLVNEWNQTAARITGFSKDEVMGRHLVDNFITEEYRESVGSVLHDALQGTETANYEFPLYTKGGDRVEVLLNATTRRDTNGSITGVVGVGQDITELAQYRAETERVAEDLTQLIDTANAPIFGIDADGLVNEWNQTAARITGFSKDEVMGRHLVDNFITEEYRESVGSVLHDALQGTETANYEFPLYTKGGDRVEVLLNATTRRDTNGSITGVVGVGQDITELAQYRAETERVAEDLTQLIDTANAPIFGIDADGLVNEWNQTAARITGFSKDEVMGRHLVDNFITEEYRESVGSVLHDALQGTETANYEFPLYTKGGDRVEVLLNATTRRDTNGSITGVVGVGQDITELAQYRAETERVAEDLTQLIDTANAPIFGIDADGMVNEWNQTAARITGFSKDEVMGRHLVDNFITEEYRESVGAVLHDALQGTETANYEFPLYTKGGDRVEVLLNATTRRDTNGSITGVVGVGQDITERQRAQLELIQASKLATLGEMATGVAHELNQPLNVILMAAENATDFVEQLNTDDTYLKSKLDRICQQTIRASSIIDHMRVFGRKSSSEHEAVDLRKAIDDVTDFMSQQMRLSEISIVKNYPENCRAVLGHHIQIQQVIINLLVNARDALDSRKAPSVSDKKITFTVTDDRKTNTLAVSIADTGDGIGVDVIDRIFEPFYTTKEVGKGTGLGLSVSYGIITDMGGFMSAENSEEGAIINLSFPAMTV